MAKNNTATSNNFATSNNTATSDTIATSDIGTTSDLGATSDLTFAPAGANVIVTNNFNHTVEGSDFADVIVITGSLNRVSARLGNDTIVGSSWSNTIDGGDGMDLIFSGTESNVLLGGNNDDVIWAGYGNDTLSGGANDGFMFVADAVIDIYPPVSPVTTWGGDTLVGGNGIDTFVVSDASRVTTIMNYSYGDQIIISGYTKEQASGFDTNILYLNDGTNETAVVTASGRWTEDAFTFV